MAEKQSIPWLFAPVWRFYLLEDFGCKCRLCNQRFCGFNSSNAKRHLRKLHGTRADVGAFLMLAVRPVPPPLGTHSVAVEAFPNTKEPPPAPPPPPPVQNTSPSFSLPNPQLPRPKHLLFHSKKVGDLERRAQKTIAELKDARDKYLSLSLPSSKRRRLPVRGQLEKGRAPTLRAVASRQVIATPGDTTLPSGVIRASLAPDLTTTAGIEMYNEIRERRARVARGEVPSYLQRPDVDDETPEDMRPKKVVSSNNGSARARKMAKAAQTQQ